MSYVVIKLDTLNKQLIVSFDPAIEDTVIDLPDVFLTSDHEHTVPSAQLTEYINGFAPPPGYINSYKAYLTTVVKQELGIPLSSIYIPAYLMNDVVFNEYVTRLVEKGKFILLGDDEIDQAEYTIKYDWEQDLTVHQSALSPDNDNYIYFRNRLAFLQHVKAYVTKVWPAQIASGEIDRTNLFEPSYLLFCVPKSLREARTFMDTSKRYRLTTSIDKPDFSVDYSPAQILDMLTTDILYQNQLHQNVISMNPSKKVWIVEESLSTSNASTAGFVKRPRMADTMGDITSAKRGVSVFIPDIVEATRETKTIEMFLQHCFYYYASPFKLAYQFREYNIVPIQLDVAISMDDPGLGVIYRN